MKGKPWILEVTMKGKAWNTYQNTKRSEDHIQYVERYSACHIIWYIVTKLTSNFASVTECMLFNPLTPNDLYISRTTPLTSKRCILYIYSTNVGTEYFKHAVYSPLFSSKCSLFHNANFFGSCIIHILYTGCAEIKKKNISGAKGLMKSEFIVNSRQYSRQQSGA